jgi:hypothetical protein
VAEEEAVVTAQGPKVEVEPAPRKIWYGWQILAVDGGGQTLAVLLGVTLGNQDGGAIGLGTGLATYALGGPIVHFAHGNVGKGFGSLALRVGLPPASAFTGAAIERSNCSSEMFCGLTGAALGLVVGTVSAIVLDTAVLAYKRVPPETTAKRSSGFESLVVVPNLSHESAGLSVGAAF